MVQLLDTDITTREVLDWRGMHLFHTPLSSFLKNCASFST